MTKVFIYCVHNERRVPIALVQRNPLTGHWSGAFGRIRDRTADFVEFSTHVGPDGEWRHRFACMDCTTVAQARDETLDRVLHGMSEITLPDLAARLRAAT